MLSLPRVRPPKCFDVVFISLRASTTLVVQAQNVTLFRTIVLDFSLSTTVHARLLFSLSILEKMKKGAWNR